MSKTQAPDPAQAKLSPCPFCGADAVLHNREGQKMLPGAYVECTGCDISTPIRPTAAEVVARWNRKAIPAPEGAPLTLPPPDTHCWDDDTGKDVWSYSADLVRSIVSAALAAPAPQADEVLIAIKRGEDYQDVHPELVAADALGNTPFEWRVIDAAPQTKEPTNDR